MTLKTTKSSKTVTTATLIYESTNVNALYSNRRFEAIQEVSPNVTLTVFTANASSTPPHQSFLAALSLAIAVRTGSCV
jgi:hypothetical protein